MSLDHVDEITHEPTLLFTEPWDPIVVRRGDALGLLAFTTTFAETVAPGLSNRVRDGRWVTILAWPALTMIVMRVALAAICF